MQAVIGQTGKIVLSDEMIHFKVSQKRTARYRYERCGSGWIAVVIGPFHSRLYGANSYGTKKSRAKTALDRSLVNNFGYIGQLLFSDVDDSDVTGLSQAELNHRANNEEREAMKNAVARPITTHELCGVTGQ